MASVSENSRRLFFALDALQKVLDDSGCRAPLMTVTAGASPSRVTFLKTYVKSAGEQIYCLLIRDQGIFASATGDQAATVVFEKPGYIYDILSGTELGYGSRLDVTLTDYTMRALAVLPYRVRRVTAELPATANPGADVKIHLSVSAEGGKPGLHVFRVDVTDPNGKLNLSYSQNAVAPAGEAEIALPFAFNDPAGDWTVRVRDVATGTAVTKTIKLAGK